MSCLSSSGLLRYFNSSNLLVDVKLGSNVFTRSLIAWKQIGSLIIWRYWRFGGDYQNGSKKSFFLSSLIMRSKICSMKLALDLCRQETQAYMID